MVSERHDLWAVAGLLVGRYGRRARAEARANARKAERERDGDTSTIWRNVADVLRRRDGPPTEPPTG